MLDPGVRGSILSTPQSFMLRYPWTWHRNPVVVLTQVSIFPKGIKWWMQPEPYNSCSVQFFSRTNQLHVCAAHNILHTILKGILYLDHLDCFICWICIIGNVFCWLTVGDHSSFHTFLTSSTWKTLCRVLFFPLGEFSWQAVACWLQSACSLFSVVIAAALALDVCCWLNGVDKDNVTGNHAQSHMWPYNIVWLLDVNKYLQ